MVIDEFIANFDHPKQNGRGWHARCPAHNDQTPSLSISEGENGRILLHCFAGCTTEEIVSALGLRLADLFEGSRPKQAARRRSRKIKELKATLKSVEIIEAGIYRRTEKILELSKGVDISRWSEAELDREMEAVCDSYEILEGERERAI